jgi:inosine/xanthosine triphosphate pyrophosphatase family protein
MNFFKKDWKKYSLLSSNQNKIAEFKRFGLGINIKTGKDLAEIQGTDLEVILHKSKDSGDFTIVEDTSLDIQNFDIGVNVRWLQNNLDKTIGNNAFWKVLLGANDGKQISVYQGMVQGKIVSPKGEGFGFDSYFQPLGSKLTLAELEEIGKKDLFSARKKAVENLLADRSIGVYDIPNTWTGDYQ